MAAKRQSNLREQHRGHQAELQDHRDDGEQHVGQQRRDAARAALDVARHAAGLPLQVEPQRKRVQVAEHLQRHAAYGALRHTHEHDVAQLGEQGVGRAQQPVQKRAVRSGSTSTRSLGVERVDDLLHHQRHADVGEAWPRPERTAQEMTRPLNSHK